MDFSPGSVNVTKLRAGNTLVLTQITEAHGRLEFKFPFSRALQQEIKTMQGAKWHGYDKNPRKIWSVENCFRNQFQLRYLMGEDPYKWFERPLEHVPTARDCVMAHQKNLIDIGWTYRVQVWAAEMGTGKTLAAIELTEYAKRVLGVQDKDIWYAGPRSGVKAVALEVIKWKAGFKFNAQTYDGWVKTVKGWTAGTPAPRIFIIDESSRIKNPSTQRSKAVFHICEAMRAEHGQNCLIILMTGTPAPKSPVDFWNQCETAAPGFLKEGDPLKFKYRLCLTEQRESLAGGMYPHMITWLDDDKKCAVCGQFENHINHTGGADTAAKAIARLEKGFTFGTTAGTPVETKKSDVPELKSNTFHKFTPSINEVAKLYRRMKGLVTVLYKKDCTDLPDKRYEVVKCKPTVELLHAAKLIKATSPRAITAMTLLRELSDGFQYEERETGGRSQCQLCSGQGKKLIPTALPEDVQAPNTGEMYVKFVEQECPHCGGRGDVPVMERIAKIIGSPKDEAYADLLDSVEDIGRCVSWGGFEGTVDRLKDLTLKEGWSVLRIDGRGYNAFSPIGEALDPNELLIAMDAKHPRFKELFEKHDKVCVVANPDAGGMALTFTASPIAIYYSNTFNGEARMQSEDRIHRIGMDKNLGATIYDLVCLKTDEIVLNNLKLKKRLQDLALHDLEI